MGASQSLTLELDLARRDEMKQGLAGHLFWRPWPGERARPLELDQERTWSLPNGYVSGRGSVDQFTSAEGWHVFALSAGRPARRVGELLRDAASWGPEQWLKQVSGPLADSLFWDLFPGAAVVAVHAETNALCLIRDVLGFYPIYYSVTDEEIRFSSSLAHLRQTVEESQVDDRALAELVVFGHQFGVRTVWKSIDVVTPGECVLFLGNSRPMRQTFVSPRTVFDPELRKKLAGQSPRELAAQSRELVERSLAAKVDGRPYVVLGGGGVDSSVLAALSARNRSDVAVWSINHPDLKPCEEDWMKPLWNRFDVPSRFVNITRGRFLETLTEMHYRSHQPLIGPNFVGAAILRKEAVQSESEQLSFVNGELCDTLFGGLSSFHQLAWTRRLGAGLRRFPRRMRHWLQRGLHTEREWFSHRVLGLPPEELALVGHGSLERGELVDEVLALDQSGASRKQNLADRLTWLDLREVPRALHHGFFERDSWYGGHWIFPFADREIFRFAVNLPCDVKYRGGHTKWLWRTMAADLIGQETAFRAKRGFDAPIHDWLRSALPLLQRGFVREAFRLSSPAYLEKVVSHDGLLWPLVNIELWGRIHCWGEPPDDVLKQLMGTTTT